MLRMVINNQIEIDSVKLPFALTEQVKNDLTLRNPKYDAATKQNRTPYGIPEYITLYRSDDHNMVLPRGYGRRLQELLIQSDVTFKVQDDRLLLPSVSFQSNIKLRAYQERAVDALSSGKQGGVVAPCGAGKTMILLSCMVRIGQPTLWVTHSLELAQQVIDRATEVLDLTEDEIGRIYGGQMTVGRRLTVALVQSLNKADMDALKNKFGAILVDEAHHLAASTFYVPVGQFPALYRIWASATPTRADGLTDMVFAGAGPILCEIYQSEVPTVIPRLEVVETTYRSLDDDYVKLINALIRDEKRNQLIVDVISDEASRHFSLVLSDRIEHLEILKRMLRIKLPELKVEMLIGSLKKSEREDIMTRVQAKQIDILLATQLAREGLDIQHLDRLFLTTPKRAAGAVQQEVGRIMRTHPGKIDAVVFDFWDSHCPILKQQFWRRREVYRKIGMDTKFKSRKAAR